MCNEDVESETFTDRAEAQAAREEHAKYHHRDNDDQPKGNAYDRAMWRMREEHPTTTSNLSWGCGCGAGRDLGLVPHGRARAAADAHLRAVFRRLVAEENEKIIREREGQQP